MAGPYAANAFANMGNAFLKSYQGELDRLEQQRRYDQEQAWKDEQRGRQRQEWQKADEFDRVLQEEYKPVAPETSYSAADEGPAMAISVRGKQFANPAEAQKYADTENTPMRAAQRAADRGMAIDPTRATKLRNDAMTSRAAELQLSKAEQEEMDNAYNRNLIGFLQGAGAEWWKGAGKLADVTFGGQVKTDFEVSPDGKFVSLFAIDQEGNRRSAGRFETDERGMQRFIELSMQGDPKIKLQSLKAVADRLREADEAEAQRANDLEDYEAKLKIASRYKERPQSPGQVVQVTGPDGKPTYARLQGNQLVPVDMGGMAIQGKRQVDPKAYAETVDKFVSAGMGLPQARIAADEMFGIAPPPAPGGDAALVQQNQQRGAKPAPAPAAKPQAIPAPMSQGERLRNFYVPTGERKTDEQVILGLQPYMTR